MLTDLQCRKAKKADAPYKLPDERGLYLYVSTTGHRSWRFKFRFPATRPQKEKRLTFGAYPEVSLVEARDLRDAARKLLREGTDPSLHKLQIRALQATHADREFKTIANAWVTAQTVVWSPAYADQVQRRFDSDIFPTIGRHPIDGITVPMISSLLKKVEARGSVDLAHRLRQHLSAVFCYAIADGLAATDPAHGVKRALTPVQGRRVPAVRSIEKARLVLQSVEAQPSNRVTRMVSRLVALTGVRTALARLAEPAEFENLDGPNPIWRISAAKMKLTQERKKDEAFEFIVPLPRQAVELVKLAMRTFGNYPILFPSNRGHKKPISDSTVSKFYRSAGWTGIHVPHGWRSTFSTVMNEIAAENEQLEERAIIDLMLAHIPKGVEAAYNRAAYMKTRRRIAQEWADMLLVGAIPTDQLLADI